MTLLGASSPQFPSYIGGIPVPGRRVPALRMFELYIHTCRPSQSGRESQVLEQLSHVIQNVDGDQIAEKMQRNLYFAVDDLDVAGLMGKWFTVRVLVDRPIRQF